MSLSENKNTDNSSIWHSMEIDAIADKLGANLDEGLSVSEATSRLEKYGENKIYEKKYTPSFLLVFLSQFFNFTSIILLLISTTLLFINFKQAVFVIVVLFLNILFGYIQQSKSETRIRTVFAPHSFNTKVIRGKRIIQLQSDLVVPGDLIVFESGDRIPSDARLIRTNSLIVDESIITDKITPSEKAAFLLPDENIPISERANMVYGGSYVIKGKGIGLVVGTGKDLELNRRKASQISNLKEKLKTDIQNQLRFLTVRIEIVGVILSLLLIGLAWLTGKNVSKIFTIVFSLVLSSIPIGLLRLSNYVLISTAFDIFRKRAKIKRLSNLETLGKIDTLFTEARGYFTDEDIEVKRIFVDGQLLEGDQLNNYLNKIRTKLSHIDESNIVPYDFSTDLHLLLIMGGLVAKNKPDEMIDILSEQATKAVERIIERTGSDLDTYISSFRVVEGAPYSSSRKQRTIIMRYIQPNSHIILTLGDTQDVIRSCSKIQLNGMSKPFENEMYNSILKIDQYLKQNSVWVLSVAYRKIISKPGKIRNEQHSMIFLGMLALEKHIRPEALKAVETCKNSGIKTITITDEDPEEAFDATSLIGIADDRRYVIDFQKVRRRTNFWDNERYMESIDRAKVFCKPTQEDKEKILSRLKGQNKHIAMTIDSPEDDQLTKNKVEIKIAIPSTASDISVNSADLLIYEGGFKTVTDTIILAKELYYTLRNSIRWILSSVVGQFLTMLIGSIIYFIRPQTFTLPISLSQIVWINLLVNILPSFAFGKINADSKMFYTKSNRVGNLTLSDYQWDIILRGTVVALISLIIFIFTAKFSLREHIQTATCTSLIFTQFITGLQCYRYSTIKKKRDSKNKSLWLIVFLGIIIHLTGIYIPFIQPFLDTVYLDIEWFWIIPFCIISFLPIDLTKGRQHNRKV